MSVGNLGLCFWSALTVNDPVCASEQYKSIYNKIICAMKDLDSDSLDTDVECVAPLIPSVSLIKEESEAWVVHAERTRTLSEGFRAGAAILMTAVSIVLCLVFYMTCPKCLFGVLLVSACMCPWFNSMNAPLWLAILLLIVSGWTFTTGYLSVTWNNGFNK
jgi:hypothetical protein